ncbi:hypothetical protein BDZ45DRAFT_681146 [Acephala macrosclerotiorum]|nr:hypothetical protein BDZ45DRAFT_681146 [Acephala macrosclerotiorum]
MDDNAGRDEALAGIENGRNGSVFGKLLDEMEEYVKEAVEQRSGAGKDGVISVGLLGCSPSIG